MLLVHEIYLSLQGESTFAGLPCVFVRLTGCNLRCSWCDTAYAFSGGRQMSIEQVVEAVKKCAAPYQASPAACGWRLPLVELTGGEPLLQKEARALMTRLCDLGHTVLIETSGALDISTVDSRVRRIMDLKCPGSGESAANLWSNIEHLRDTDEIKFVIATVEDYEWAKSRILACGLAGRCPLLFSWAHPIRGEQRDSSLKAVPAGQTPISRRELAERIIAEALPVRFQAQLHKIIWPPEQRGV